MFQSSAIEFIVLYNPIVLHFDYSYIFSFPTFLKCCVLPVVWPLMKERFLLLEGTGEGEKN